MAKTSSGPGKGFTAITAVASPGQANTLTMGG